jgi:hypothetical protein
MGDARLDMTDLFAFPANLPDRTVLILDCDPVAPTGGDERGGCEGSVQRRLPDTDWDAYADIWAGVLAHTGAYTPEAAKAALRVVLPDVLRYDRSRPAIYPNGRTLTDDITSARLTTLTNGKVPTDNIPPHQDLLRDFPYLGNPHPVMATAKG